MAVSAPGRPPLEFAAAAEVAATLAARLRGLEARRSDRVALVLPAGPEALTAFLGVSAAAVCAPLNPASTPAELATSLSSLEARMVVVGDGAGNAAAEVARARGIDVIELEVDPAGPAGRFSLDPGPSADPGSARAEDAALALHTSGTTARSKLVELTHANLSASADTIAAGLELGEGDVCLNVMPLFHIHGLVGAALSSLSAGAAVACTPGFQATRFAAWLEELGATWYTAVPTIHAAAVSRARPGLRFVRSSSAPLAPRLERDLGEAFDAPVVQAYGMTEASHQIASNPLDGERRRGSVGLPTGTEIRILEENDEVAVRGPSLFHGYAGDPAATEAAFVDGWFRTGDRGRIDEDGYLFLTGRLKELINRGGEKISPAEVEEALLEHAAVSEACAFSLPDERLGEDVGAAVVLRPGTSASAQELQETVAVRLAPFKVPRVVELVEELPRGPSGKVQRRRMPELLGLDGAAGARTAGGPPTGRERELAALWAAVLEIEEESVGLDESFFALGGDSVAAAELMAELETREGRPLPWAALVWAPTVRSLAAWLEGGAPEQAASVASLRTAGTKTPFFFVPCVHSGGLYQGAALTGPLGSDQPFHCLVTPVDDDAAADPEHWFQRVAGGHVTELRTLQPNGPYRVGGVGHGALIALEVARHLHTAGQEVSLLVLVDPPTPEGAYRGIGRIAQPTHVVLESLLQRRLPTTAVLGRIADRLRAARPQKPPRTPFQRAAEAARRVYDPEPYPGRIVILHTEDAPVARWFWAPLSLDGLEWHDLRVPAADSFRQPHVAVLGERLRELLAR